MQRTTRKRRELRERIDQQPTTTKGTGTMASKNSETEKRSNLFSDSPMNIGIIGGHCIENEDERGPLDTAPDLAHELFSVAQELRLREELDEPFWRGIDFNGVKVPITVKRYGAVLFVVVGRRRLRAARRANAERARRGEPPMVISYIIEQSNDKARLAGMVMLENSARMNDSIASKIEQARSFMERYSCDVDIAAMYLNEKPNVVESWLRFDDAAIDDVKSAVYDGRMAISAGIEIARAKTPDAQLAAFKAALDASMDEDDDETGDASKPKKISTRAARNAAKSVTKPNSNAPVDDKRTQKRLLQAIRDKSHGKAGEATIAFWEGVECMLSLVLGGDEASEAMDSGVRGKALGEMLRDVRKAMKSTKAAK